MAVAGPVSRHLGVLVLLGSLIYGVTTLNVTDPLHEGQQVIRDFYSRYNATKKVDLVFILDRSGSVPSSGWQSMINFVRDVLEHFTVDGDNTRVAIITYSTKVRVDINDLEPKSDGDLENKCTLNSRLGDYVQPKVQYGFTATFDALNTAHDLLVNSRPDSKKAVLLLTDGKSNIGAPPVKAAFHLLSLSWNQTWDSDRLGPQVI